MILEAVEERETLEIKKKTFFDFFKFADCP